jgi:processive 1,2-diacylglycerol beta-glucosyltransferase
VHAYRTTLLLNVALNLIMFAACCASTVAPISAPPDVTATSPRKKIMVLISKGGNGHMAACNVLKESLPEYDIQVVNPFDIVTSFNIVKKVTANKLDGEQFYVTLVQHNLVRTASFLAKYPAPMFFHLRRHYFVKRFVSYLKEQQPDLLISTIPYFDYAASTAAQRCSIPFLLVTLDANLYMWLGDFKKCRNNDNYITVAVKTPRIMHQLERCRVPADRIYEVGAPLRKDFFEPKDREKIMAEWNLPRDKPIAMLIRGGTGSSQLGLYVRSLLKLNRPLHLLVCVGKNAQLAAQIKKIHAQGKVSFSVIPFTQKIADLMAVSDMVITQPSPNVCNEAMQSGVPILIDLTGPSLFWERATMDWIQTRKAGASFKKFKHLNRLVADCLEGKLKFNKTRDEQPRFNAEIKKIVQRIFEKKLTSNKNAELQCCSTTPNLPALPTDLKAHS